MTVAAVLLAYAAGLGILGSRMLARARWTARAPLLAIVTYLAAGWSVIAALGLAGLTLAVFLGQPGVLEARRRITLRMRAARPGHEATSFG